MDSHLESCLLAKDKYPSSDVCLVTILSHLKRKTYLVAGDMLNWFLSDLQWIPLSLCPFPSLFQQGNFNSSIGSDGYMLSALTCGMAPVTSITEGLQQVSSASAHNRTDRWTDCQDRNYPVSNLHGKRLRVD